MVSFKGFCQFPGYADGNIRIQRRQSLHGFDDAMGGFIKNTGMGSFHCRLEHSVFFPGFDGQKTAEACSWEAITEKLLNFYRKP